LKSSFGLLGKSRSQREIHVEKHDDEAKSVGSRGAVSASAPAAQQRKQRPTPRGRGLPPAGESVIDHCRPAASMVIVRSPTEAENNGPCTCYIHGCFLFYFTQPAVGFFNLTGILRLIIIQYPRASGLVFFF